LFLPIQRLGIFVTKKEEPPNTIGHEFTTNKGPCLFVFEYLSQEIFLFSVPELIINLIVSSSKYNPIQQGNLF
jgi:hypothetical protein